MHLSALPVALLLLASASLAQEGGRVVPVERLVPVEREPDGAGLDAARRALANGDERAAARELERAAGLLRVDAAGLDEGARVAVLDVAAQVAGLGTEVELGNVDEAMLDRRLSSAMRSLAAHHIALSRVALARTDAALASEHLNIALDCLERALRWRGAGFNTRTGTFVDTLSFNLDAEDSRLLAADLEGALALAADVKRALDIVSRAIDEETARAAAVPLAPAEGVR